MANTACKVACSGYQTHPSLLVQPLAISLGLVLDPSMASNADLISLVIQQLIEGTCQSFRRPSGPSDSLVADVPAMAAFAKAALDGGIEHDAATALYQVNDAILYL